MGGMTGSERFFRRIRQIFAEIRGVLPGNAARDGEKRDAGRAARSQTRFGGLVHGLRFKIFITYLGVVVAILVLLNVYPTVIARDFVVRAKRTEFTNNAAVLANTLVARHQELTEELPADDTRHKELPDVEIISEVYNLLNLDKAQRVIVTDYRAQVVFDSAFRSNLRGKVLLLGDTISALNGGGHFMSNYQGDAFEFSVSAPLVLDGVARGMIFIYEYTASEAGFISNSQQNILLLSVGILVASIAASFLFTGLLTRQIGAIGRAVKSIKAGVYDSRAEVFSKDELGQLAEEFNELSDRLWQTEEKRRQFVSNASHELKTPLASIKLLSDSVLQSENINKATINEFLGDINGEIDRLTRITDRLLTLTRLDADGEMREEAVDLAGVVVQTAKLLAPLIRRSELRLSLQLEQDCPVLGDPDGITQITVNLMENAIKYNRPGGKLGVGIRREGDRVELRVKDTGVGIAAGELDRIFERFYRVDKAHSRETGGTGLGLAIVKKNVQLMGAELTVRSVPGKGSVFCVRFRAAAGGGDGHEK